MDTSSSNKLDPFLAHQIEACIQQREKVTIPALLFEYLSTDNIDFEYQDFKNFFEQFGEVEYFELKGKISFVLFKTFLIASICKEFLQNERNFKVDLKKDFVIKWFQIEEDQLLFIDNVELCEKIRGISANNSKSNYIPKSSYNNIQQQQQQQQQQLQQHQQQLQLQQQHQHPLQQQPHGRQAQLNNAYQHCMNMNSNMMGNQQQQQQQMGYPYHNYVMQQMQMMPKGNQQDYSNSNSNNKMDQNYNMNMNNDIANEEKCTYGKFTCKYEILIQNDKDFQIAKKLIGSKGCNMKSIIDACKVRQDDKTVKLRLRGKGSGFREGPQKKESDDPLHLCISASNQESIKKACKLVSELLDKIYEEYCLYCIKMKINPLSQIAIKIEGGNPMIHKGSNR